MALPDQREALHGDDVADADDGHELAAEGLDKVDLVVA